MEYSNKLMVDSGIWSMGKKMFSQFRHYSHVRMLFWKDLLHSKSFIGREQSEGAIESGKQPSHTNQRGILLPPLRATNQY